MVHFYLAKHQLLHVYLDILTECVAPQLYNLQPTIIFQQDGSPPHWSLHIHGFLKQSFRMWIGRNEPNAWPLRSPDNPKERRYVKDAIYRTKAWDTTDAIATVVLWYSKHDKKLSAISCNEWRPYINVLKKGKKKNFDIYSFWNNFYIFLPSLLIILNCKKTLWTLCIYFFLLA